MFPSHDHKGYSIDGPVTIQNARVNFDLNGLELKAGATITFDIRFDHSQFSGQTPFPSETTDNVDIGFSFNLPTDFNSVYELATDPLFTQSVGTAANIKPVSGQPGDETSCDGTTFTDSFNCLIPQNLDSLTKFASGISANGS